MNVVFQAAVPEGTDLFSLVEWKDCLADGLFNGYDGSGCWVKDGFYMTSNVYDDVFAAPPEGATHVAWFNK